MNEVLDRKLCERYPKIFKDRHADMKESAMHWGFDCGDGWYWLIDTLCAHIQQHIDNNPHLNIHQVVATQVKEKFGGLRFYYSGGDESIDGIISHAEFLSYRTCESCGVTWNVGWTRGWIRTVCKVCYDKRGYREEWVPIND